jgi:hypothetical protein
MKKNSISESAFFNPRVLAASLLFLTAGMLTLFALAGAEHNNTQTSSSPRWLTRLASTLGIESPSKRFSTSGGAVKLDKNPAERPPVTSRTAPAIPYSGPPHDLSPVTAVRTGKLRDMRPIDPEKVEKHYHPEPILPKPPTQSGGPEGPIQTLAGPLASAPTPTGVSFEGVGVGLGGFNPGSNPPDVNGRVGATQYVQWNNTSFAVFDKTTGALEYGPAAGNTLFQALGGACASHNDGDPVVSYDILAGRWVLSQFVVAAGQTTYSHQCVAVSTTSDATGEYYVYDFLTDATNFVDYPHTGMWPDGYYMTAHVFSVGPEGLPVAAPNAFITARLYVFERDKMVDGLPARMQSVDLGRGAGLLVADLDSLTPPAAGEAEFVIGPSGVVTNTTLFFRVATTWGAAPAVAAIEGTPITNGIANAPCLSGVNSPARDCVPQPAPAVGTDYLDHLGGHYMYRLAYRNQGTQAAPDESIVMSGTTTGVPTTHGAVKWWEFRNPTPGSSTTTPTIFQSGTYDPDTSYRWMPSIAMDKDRNIALGYSKSSTTIKPGIYLTGRLAGDSAGTMGAETEMQAGLGVQLGGGNRWGDYSSMTIDPIDQCTFYYTNEYLKTNGAFNWSTRIAAFKFPSCVSAANLYGTVTGTITSSETGNAPISGVRVALSNGYAGASNASGVYTILVPVGTYTAAAADPARNCASASPASAVVSPPGGGTVIQNFVMTGVSKLEANGFSLDDSLGNANGIVNRAECVKVNLGIKNNGCAKETAISGHLTTTTPGVTIAQADSSYSDKAIDASGTNLTPFKISVSNSFSCGTPIALSLNLTYASGSKSIAFTVPTCAGGPDQQIPLSQLTTSDSTQQDRIGRDSFPSTCGGKTSPGGGFTGTHYYKTFTFNNTSGGARCYTVTIDAGLNGPGDIESVAYDQTYDPTMISTNYLGDSGISGLGTSVAHASYSFTVPAGHNFVVVVNTTGSTTSGNIASSQFSGTVSGFIDNTAGPGDCSTIPPEITGAVSRKTHGGLTPPPVGPGDLPLNLDPITAATIEPRSGGSPTGNHTLVFRFVNTLTGPGATSITATARTSSGTQTLPSNQVSGSIGTDTHEYIVNLTGVPNASHVNVTLNGVTDSAPSSGNVGPVRMDVLLGDVNQTGGVDGNDVSAVQAHTRQAVSATTFQFDVNTTGGIDGNDVSLTQSKTRTSLP